MKTNKNIFALALCFVAFTAQADNSNEVKEETEKTIVITIKNGDSEKTVLAIVVTPEQAFNLLSKNLDEDTLKTITITDGLAFHINQIIYFVQSDKSDASEDEVVIDNADNNSQE